MVSVRYLVNDVDESIEFYRGKLGFELVEKFGSAMAIVRKGELQLWLAGPKSSAAQILPDGSKPKPGGWSRFVYQVADLSALVAELRSKGARFKTEIIQGPGGQQILCEDPSGNLIEIFQPN